MDISARKFTATQCLYTIVLNNPQLRLTTINGTIIESSAKAAVVAAFRLAEMMDEEAENQLEWNKPVKEQQGTAIPS